MAKKEKQKRVCGFCQKSGHNIRSCEVKKAGGSGGESVETVTTATSSSTALVPMMEVEAATGVANPHMPIEFEEAVKQVNINGTSLRLSCREFDSGQASLTLRFHREGSVPKDLQLDVELASKLYKLLGWALQRQAAKGKQPARSNGLKSVEAR